MSSRLLSLIALFCLAVPLCAQKQPPEKFQVFAGYSYISNSLNGVSGEQKGRNGWDASVAFAQWHDIRFKIDVSAYVGTNQGAPETTYSILGGAQFSHRIGRETVYVEGLAGDGGANVKWASNNNNATGQTVSFVSLLGGGLDTPITRRIAFRVDGGYQYSYFALNNSQLVPYRIPGLPTNFGRISTGLVFKF